MIASKMYMLRQGSKTIGVVDNSQHYVIAFNNIITARKVHYNIHPDPCIHLDRVNNLVIAKSNILNLDLRICPNAQLKIPKVDGSVWDAKNDGSFHLHSVTGEEFVMYPFSRGIGVIIAHNLKDENNDSMMFDSILIEPSADAQSYKDMLRNCL